MAATWPAREMHRDGAGQTVEHDHQYHDEGKAMIPASTMTLRLFAPRLGLMVE